MTHEHVSSLVSDLVHMAEATRRLPEIERELDEAKRRTVEDGERIARLELRIHDLIAERDTLQSKLRSVEAERDDAGFRQLEAEDKVAHLRAVAESFVSDLGSAFAALSGDGKTKYVRMAQAEVNELAEWSEAKARAKAEAEEAARPADPTVSTDIQSGPVNTQTVFEPTNASGEAGEGQREPGPTASSAISSETAPDTSASPPNGVQSDAGLEQLGKYHGKLYREWPYYVSEASWIENGGTHESYWEGRQGFRAAN